MNKPKSYSNGNLLPGKYGEVQVRPNLVFGIIILAALLAFEIFNFSTTDYALRDLLGELTFAGIHWATILSIAFCGIDFAGIARLFTPEQNGEEPKEVWYLFGAWFLAATMNAVLTWWGVSMAITNHAVSSTSVVDPTTLTKVVPIFVALMVWVIRILIIGSLSMAVEQMFGAVKPQPALRSVPARPRSYTTAQSHDLPARSQPVAPAPVSAASRPQPQRTGYQQPREIQNTRPEPSYHSLTRNARPAHRPGSHTGDNNRQM